MKFKSVHVNRNIFDLEKSLRFYGEALDFFEVRRINAADGSFIIVFLSDGCSDFLLELTWLKDRDRRYDLGDNEIHMGLKCAEYDEAYKKHKSMGCVCYENPEMGIYFIEDPDGYWIEIIPAR
ncbi:MAG: VOC family protein [Clostridiales bacterium]|jgi:lactoylglutathione lyase|nr:VOC family protein [Clostridiales bacterium]